MKRIVLLTGLAGAGRTTASDILEDMGFYVIENLPASIAGDVISQMSGDDSSRIALAVDLRDQISIDEIFNVRDSFRASGDIVDIVFLDADDDTIIRRFEQTRRPHPYIASGVLSKAIEQERDLLRGVLVNADVHIDTTTMNPTQLSRTLSKLFKEESSDATIIVNSFGFKYGTPRDTDFIFDVRFLPNPYWEQSLKELTGLDSSIRDYVTSFEGYEQYLEALKTMLKISITEFTRLGKTFISISFGCTGGYHRSVVVSNEISNWLRKENYRVITVHRELDESEDQ